jgi:hypothetical protein
MSNKQSTNWSGSSTTNTNQGFANWFDNMMSSSFGQKTTSSSNVDSLAKTTMDQSTRGTTDTTGTTTNTSDTQNRYGYMTAPESSDVAAYRSAVDQLTNQSDPSIKFQAASAMRQARNRYGGPFGMGAGQSAATRQAMLRSEAGGIQEKEGQSLIQDAFNRRQQKLGALGQLASLGQARTQLVNLGGKTTATGTSATSGTQTGTTTGTTTTEGSQKMTGTQDTTGESKSETMGAGGGEQWGTQTSTEKGQQTTSQPLWGSLISGAAQVGAAGASKGMA